MRDIPATRSMHHLLPIPRSVELTPGTTFAIGASTVILVPGGDSRLLGVGRWLAGLIGRAAGPRPPEIRTWTAAEAAGIRLELGEVSEPGDEAYDLNVTPSTVTIRGRTAAGVFLGAQTFRQLVPPFVEHGGSRAEKGRDVVVPCGRVTDAPRFEWRGAMLDVSRHFLPARDVKRFIDLMALLKLNRLHLHLTDDQGWRIEIRSWPNLTAHGGSTQVGGGPGGWYSQGDYADLVAYAADRFVTIVPEIDLPGHTTAALASYPALAGAAPSPSLYTGIEVGFSVLDVGSETTQRFVEDVVREVAGLTPGRYLHIGGDEVRSLSSGQYAQFVAHAQAIVEAHGKQAVGWDEIAAAPLRPGTIVQHWRPESSPREAVSRGARVILSPADRVYMDMKHDARTPIGLTWAGLIDVARAYDWDPASTLAGVAEPAILGVEAPLWTETVAGIRDVEYMMFPRLAAVAELAWSRQSDRSLDDFTRRVGAQAPRWTALGITFHRDRSIPWDPD
jgi:hexosaminidase